MSYAASYVDNEVIVSDEIEKIESEGLSEDDKADIEAESKGNNSSVDELDETAAESVDDLSEAYSNVVTESGNGKEEDSDQNNPDATDDESLDSEPGTEQDEKLAEENSVDKEDIEEEQEQSVESESISGSTMETEVQPEDVDDSEDEDSEDSGNEEGISESESVEISTCSVIEAILFAADEPVNARKLVEILNAGGVKEVKKHIKDLNKKYKKMDCAFRIEELAGGYQLLTLSAYKPWLSKLIKVRSESKLTSAAMETLSIIAYKQPIMRVEIENIRGVAAGEMIRQLIEKGMVKIVGRAEELGRPLLYGTTQKFLDIFGLGSLKDLPQPEEQK